MTPEHWQRIDKLFHAARGLPQEDRENFLAAACGDDESLRREVESLISAHERVGEFLNAPAYPISAGFLEDNQPASEPGEYLGRYKIVGQIGAGGMGEVYLALDEKLGRRVAIKLLPGGFTRDEARLRRFEQEGRVASALNHPNVCMIHEVSETDEGYHFIVMEYVEGETLRRYMADKRMELTVAIDVAMQVASALAAAHGVGVVHRDIKPENIMLRSDGYVKVLDFGLAKLGGQRLPGDAVRTSVKTETGMVMGTSSYMSPEQARGLAVDARTDVWSLGVVLYEMIARHVPFEGETNSDVMVSILEREPLPLVTYLPETPAELQRIVTKALSKAREERYQTINELSLDLKNLKQEFESGAKLKKAEKPRTLGGHQISRIVGRKTLKAKRLVWSSSALLLLTSIGAGIWRYVSRPALSPSLPPMTYVSFTSFPGWEGNPAFSPEGNQIAFNWRGDKNDNVDIYVMSIGSNTPSRLTTDPAADYGPTWSPDGRQIAFVRSSESEVAIYTAFAGGGSERKLLSLGSPANWGEGTPGLDWSPDGKYIASVEQRSRGEPSHLLLFSPETGATRSLTSPARGEIGDGAPVFSPDSQTVAFVRRPAALSDDVYLVPVAGGEPRRLTFDRVPLFTAAWTADGREIVFSSTRAGGDFSLWRISAAGGSPERLAVGGHYVPGVTIARQRNRLAYVQFSGDFNIYRIEIPASTNSGIGSVQLTPSTRLDYAPQYSPDGKRIAFQSARSGTQEIWTCDNDGLNHVQVTSLGKWAGTPRWSPDGKLITFDLHAGGTSDIYVVSAEGGRPRPLVTGDSDDNVPSWSRDGRWIYFASNRTGESQVYKVPAEGGEAVQVTRQGGGLAFESFDGKYVYYVKDSALGILSNSTPGIWRVPVAGGEELQILDSFNSGIGNWAVVHDGIYFINPNAKEGVAIEFFDFAARKVKLVAGLGKVNILGLGIAVSPDRRHILYTQDDHSGGDIMVVENFR